MVAAARAGDAANLRGFCPDLGGRRADCGAAPAADGKAARTPNSLAVKSDRLISLLLLLQSRPQSTARTLAETLEVSERTVYRDVDALSAAGVPVYANRGSTGGITLSEGYRRALMHFSEDEVRALFFSGESPLADLGFDRGLSRALSKLEGGFAEVARKAAEKARSRVHLDARRWNQDEPPRLMLTTLRRAVWDDRCLQMTYEDRNRRSTDRVVEPLGLVSKA